jgi:hypothetical protein
MTTHQVFLAVYKTQTVFHVPKGVRLLSLDDNKNAGDVAGSWYIKWDKLIYLDKDLKEVEVDGDEFEMDKKRPDEITEEDEEEEARWAQLEEASQCGECGVSTSGRKIRGLWNNTLCEKCGEEDVNPPEPDGDGSGDE